MVLLLLCAWAQWGMAQAPKWIEKAKRAVFSVITYDQNDKILNTGNGFFVTEDGVAVSDYALFKGACRAVVVNSEGVQMPVLSIMGANDMYDAVKFRVGISSKKVPVLAVASAAPAVDTEVYVLPYSTAKTRTYAAGKVKESDRFSEGFHYYTLNLALTEKMVSCPVMTTDGQVFALAQRSSGKDTASICYALDVNYALSQKITPLSGSDMALRNIGIKKALPETEEDALVFLFMSSSQLDANAYGRLLDDFIEAYPNSGDGYIRRASHWFYKSQDEETMRRVVSDLDKALEVAQKKDDVYYNRSKLMYAYVVAHPDKPFADWSYDKALSELDQAIAVNPLPVYTQFQGDIYFAQQKYAEAFERYDQVNKSSIASPATYFSAARTKELMEAPAEETLALMDSCMNFFKEPYTQEAAPYLLERAQMRLNAKQARMALADYDAYFKAMKGQVNDLFYYYREQAALQSRQYQRALDDIAKAVELNPAELAYRSEWAALNIRVGRSEQAIPILEEALKIDGKYAEAYRLMGVAKIQLKRDKEACEDFAKAKALGDTNVDALIQKHCQK